MRLAWSPVYCLMALCTTLLVSGCGTNDESAASTAQVAPTKPARVELPDGPPGPRVVDKVKRFVRYGTPRQPLIVDTSPQDDGACCVTYEELLEGCDPNCDAYRWTRLERRKSPWHATPVRNGRSTITYPGNQCNGAPTEIVVNGLRVDVYRYFAVDPVPDDQFGVEGCTLALGPCDGEACEMVVVRVDAPDGTKLDHGGIPALKTPCLPWPRCQSKPRVPSNPDRSPLTTAANLAST